MATKELNSDEEIIQFPCEIAVKIFIKNDLAFEAIVRAVVDSFSEKGCQLTAWSTRDSKAGKYLAVTAQVDVVDREAIDALFQALVDHEHVIMVI